MLVLKSKSNKWLIISITVTQEEAITDRMLGVSTALSIVIHSLYYCYQNRDPLKQRDYFGLKKRLTHLPWGGNGGVVEFDPHCCRYFPLPLTVRSRLAFSASGMLQFEKQETEVQKINLKIKVQPENV